MPPELILGLFNVVAPIVRDIIAQHQAATGHQTGDSKLPTDAEIAAIFAANIDKYTGEGEAWRKAHPFA